MSNQSDTAALRWHAPCSEAMGEPQGGHDEDIVLAPGLAGSVPQDRRRAEIARFKRDPDCRLFLSTDSGSVGLNLQIASSVINLDLPWNPAKLEQRIARAWRKNQMRTVDVINLVTEDSIEHVMLQVLSQKQALADGVLDGQDDLKAMKLPSGRRAFVERMSAMMAPPAAPVPTALTEQRLRDELVEAHGDGLLSWRRADPPMTARSCWWCWRTPMLRWWNSSGWQRRTGRGSR